MKLQWRNSADRYGLVQIVFHWVTVVAVAVLIPLGLWMTSLDYYDPWYRRAPDIHRALGVLLGLLLLARLLARWLQPRPRPLSDQALEHRLAQAAHGLLYLLPLLIVLSGYLLSTADGRAVDVFGWFSVPATVQGIDGQADLAGDIHFVLAMVLLAVVALHAAAAFRHHWLLRDDTLRRMLPRGPNSKPKEDARR
jgi:cytochrome b561